MVTDPRRHPCSGQSSPSDACSPASASRGCKRASADHLPSKQEGTGTDRYDRQIRIWGDHGQDALSRSSVLLLGSSAVAGEVLKNLVLPGIHRFLVVDDALVTLSDLRNSSFFRKEDLGKLRSEVLAREVGLLNPDVRSSFLGLCPQDYVDLCERKKPRPDLAPETSQERSASLSVPAVYGQQAGGSSNACAISHDGRSLTDHQNAIGLMESPGQFSLVVSCQQPLHLLLRLSDLCGLESPQLSSSSARSISSPLGSRFSPSSSRLRSQATSPSVGCPSVGSSSDSFSSPARVPPRVHLCSASVVPLMCVSSVGLLGCVRVSAGVRCLVERRAQANVDLRLFDPFPELYDFAMKYDLDRMDDVAHAQVPFVAILIQVLDRYRREKQGSSSRAGRTEGSSTLQRSEAATSEVSRNDQSATPLPVEARGQLEAMIEDMRRHPDEVNFDEARANVYRILRPYEPSEDVMQVIEEASQESFHIPGSPGFSHLARALAAFQRASHRLPLQGSVPDMTCDTDSFIRMQQLYAKRAEGDCNAIKASVAMLKEGKGDEGNHEVPQGLPDNAQIRRTPGGPHTSRARASGIGPRVVERSGEAQPFLTQADVEKFCKNVHDLKIIRYRSLRQEFTPSTINRAVFEEAAASLGQDDTDEGVSLVPWYVALWASHRFAQKKGFFPGVRPSGSFPENSVDGEASSPDCQGRGERKSTDGSGESAVSALRPSSGALASPGEQKNHSAPPPSVSCRPLADDVQELKEEVGQLVNDIGVPEFVVDGKIVEQIVAFGGSEFPTTAAIVGGVAAQEAVKLLCGQFEPINNTFIWNGVERKSEVLEF